MSIISDCDVLGLFSAFSPLWPADPSGEKVRGLSSIGIQYKKTSGSRSKVICQKMVEKC